MECMGLQPRCITFIILESPSLLDNYELDEKEKKGSRRPTREQKSVRYKEFENPIRHYKRRQQI